MIKPEIIMLTSPDMGDMQTETPQDTHNFCILVQALIGEQGVEGAEVFYFLVCTPKALAGKIPAETALGGHSFIFVKEYNYQLIRQTIQGFCDKAAVAGDWDQFAQLMGKFSRWEYDDE